MDIFLQLTAGLTDGQYYALVILISVATGCLLGLFAEYLQTWYRHNYMKRVLIRKRLFRFLQHRVRGRA